jgi:hypothetical protein
MSAPVSHSGILVGVDGSPAPDAGHALRHVGQCFDHRNFSLLADSNVWLVQFTALFQSLCRPPMPATRTARIAFSF